MVPGVKTAAASKSNVILSSFLRGLVDEGEGLETHPIKERLFLPTIPRPQTAETAPVVPMCVPFAKM